MTSEALTWVETPKMAYARTGNHIVGFGKRDLTFDQLIAEIQRITGREISWVHLKQTHSKTVLESRREHATRDELLLREGDAHFSTDTNIGLIVKTADCLPVLMFASDGSLCAAVHAGWRGVENEILRETIRTLKNRGVNPAKLKVFIGPHIRQKSFEVDHDVAQQLTLTAQNAGLRDPQQLAEIVKPFGNSDSGKYVVDLEIIAVAQLMSEAVPKDQIQVYGTTLIGSPDQRIAAVPDTKTNPEWASYRRDGKNAGRNLSFIVSL